MRTSPVHDLLGVACQCDSSILGIQVKLLCRRAEMFNERPEHASTDFPFVLCGFRIEERMHHFNRFICEFICFDDSCRLSHL